MSSSTLTDKSSRRSIPTGSKRRKKTLSYRRRRTLDILFGLAGWIILLGAWEITSDTGLVDSTFSSSPSGWAAALWRLITSGEIGPDIWATLKTMLIGLLLGIVIGVPLGIMFAWFRFADRMTSSIVSALYSVPFVAFVPLVIIWFGIGDTGRIALITWSAFFPVLINTAGGVRNLDRNFLRVAEAYCAPQWKTMTSVILPGALPYVLTGVRLAVGRALVAAVVAEFFMSSAGLGYFINNSASAFNMNDAFAAVVIIGVLGVVLVQLTSLLEKTFSSWTSAG